MDATVIVALPAVDERVNRISSEKVPHLTLLYLAPTDDLAAVVQFVQHAAKNLAPFGLSVDYRGPLGPDDADVLFFEDNRWDLDNVKAFRNNLLMDNTIKRLYDSVEQYPEWTPHLTLGYPATPAHEDTADYPGIHHVSFNRIAVWTGDYEGPEFRLKYPDHSSLEVSMSSTAQLGEDAVRELFHYGVKGMRWGVRKAEKAQGRADKAQETADKWKDKAEARTGKLGAKNFKSEAELRQKIADKAQAKADKKWEKVDKKWEKSIYSTSGAVAVHNKVADQMNNGLIDKLNSDPRWRDADLTKPENASLHDDYMTEYLSLQSQAYSRAVREVHGNSPSQKKTAEYVEYETPYGYEAKIEVKSRSVKHADDDGAENDLTFFVKLDSKGLAQNVNQAEEGELKHYGVKGMKWGVRKDEATSRGGAESGPTAVVVSQKKPGKFAKAEGGSGYPLHPDAEAALKTRQRAKKSTTDSLSNAELQSAIQRMQLEQRFDQLEFSSDRRSAGRRFVAGLFGRKKPTKYRDLHEQAGEQTADQVKKAIAARAALKAAAAAA